MMKRRILLFYERRDAAAWLAHLDMMRLFERSLSRADWPLSWTVDAFNPRPEIVFGLPAGVGIETRKDPLEVRLAPEGQLFEPDAALLRLNLSFPAGVRVTGWQETDSGSPSLMARVRAAQYRLEAEGIGSAFSRTFAGGPVEVVQERKKRRIPVDLATRVFSSQVLGENCLSLMGGAGSTGHLRIDLLLEALVLYGGLRREAAQGASVVRLAVFLDGHGAGQGIIT
ncbi:MAG: DUF2344 domain-containing protein [Fastidiosipila sp.]|jgi:radical SAM-linked protein|nr:DUF2344 domain-containing protein [Fastidiosipila sp.]HPX92985.1 TIGR03936 family radical SAM-associated protein [Bacillota bacterium]